MGSRHVRYKALTPVGRAHYAFVFMIHQKDDQDKYFWKCFPQYSQYLLDLEEKSIESVNCC